MQRRGRIAQGLLLTALLAACDRAAPSVSDPKIIGGREAGSHPFMAGLIDEGGRTAFCGASFIARDVVLTAAHCVKDAAARMRVSVGLRNNSDHGNAATIAVAAVRIHPDYLKVNDDVMGNDIALLFLAAYDEDALPADVQPIALNTQANLPETATGGFATVIGWGNTTSYGSLFEDGLREVDVPVVSLESCRDAYGAMQASQICAGDFALGGKDSCQGDSGGPLIAKNGAGDDVLVGVVSWGDGCALSGKPGVYSRVSAFKAWIDGETARFRATNPTTTAADVTDFVDSHCYAKLEKTTEDSEGGNDLTLTNRFLPTAAFTSGEGPGGSSSTFTMTPCHFSLGGAGDAFKVELQGATETTLKLVAKRTAPAASWTAPAAPSTKAVMICEDSELKLLYDPQGRESFVFTANSYYDFASPFSGTIRADAVIKECAVHGFKLRFIEQTGILGKQYIGEITAPVVGGTKRFSLEKWTGGAAGQLALNFKKLDATSGELKLENTLTTDLHTWDLACEFGFTIIDAAGKQHAPVDGSDGLKHWKFSTPTDTDGTIRAGATASMKYATTTGLPAVTANRCLVNKRPVEVTVQ